MLGMLPIALQQAASVSYDAVVNGIVFLFIADCLSLAEAASWKKSKIVLLVITGVLIALVKGGVYLPVLLLAVLIFRKKEKPDIKKKLGKKKMVVAAGVVIAALAVICVKLVSVVWQIIRADGSVERDGDALYTFRTAIQNPWKTVCLYWNTLMNASDNHVRGLLGGSLSWLDIKINWNWLIILLVGLLLMSNVEGDRFSGGKKRRLFMVGIAILSVLLIMTSMLVGYTTISASNIQGLQGRYYLVLAPLVLLPAGNSMVCVNQRQCKKIWMTVLLTEALVLLQVVAAVM
jgi:uncharacterized membrane protein